MIFEFTYGDKNHTVNIDEKDGSFFVTIGDKTVELDVNEISPGCLSILRGNESRTVYVAADDAAVHVDVAGLKFRFDKITGSGDASRPGAGAGLTGTGALLMPMPGKIIKINVSAGDQVKAGQTLIVIESMKMEQNVLTPVGGTVKKVHVSEGQQVDLEETLLEVEPEIDKGG